MIMNWVTDPKFLVGLAIGVFVLPYGIKFVQLQMSARTSPAAPTA